MDEHQPQTHPGGALTPAPGVLPSTVAASAPLPLRDPASQRLRLRRQGLRGLLDSALDGLDTIGDRIAEAAGLR